MKKLLLAVLTGFALSMFMAAASSAGPVLQMRLAADAPSDGEEKMSYVTHRNGESVTQVFYVQKEVLLDETMLKSAKTNTDKLGHDVIDLTLTETGAKKFAEVTRENIHKRLAILIDGNVCEAPMIQMEISGGKAQISGDFSKEKTKDLVKKLNDAVKRK